MERQVIADITAAAGRLGGGRMPPFTEDSWHLRLGRIADWAEELRSAARAGGWKLQPVVGRRPKRPAGMVELLSGIYAIDEQGEIWMKQFLADQVPSERTVAAARMEHREDKLLRGPTPSHCQEPGRPAGDHPARRPGGPAARRPGDRRSSRLGLGWERGRCRISYRKEVGRSVVRVRGMGIAVAGLEVVDRGQRAAQGPISG
ncbi:hypothetical protein ACWKSP_15380 [Micromonosporaceae bacterium Da 78-11]